MKRANQDVRDYAYEKKVRLWKVAARMGLNDGNLSRKLRFDLAEDKKIEIKKIIDQIAEEESNEWNEFKF